MMSPRLVSRVLAGLFWVALGAALAAADRGAAAAEGTVPISVSREGDSPIFGPTLRVVARKSGQSPAEQNHDASPAFAERDLRLSGGEPARRDADKAEHATGDINPLSLQEIKGDLAIWTAAVFLVLLLILWKFAWKPLAQGLDKRERGINEQIAQAEQANQQARDLLAHYEQKLAGSQEQVRAILEQARRDAEQVGRDMLEKAKGEARAEHQRALRQIETATAVALKELAELSATLAVELAGKIVHAQLNPQDHAQLIEQAVADFGREAPSRN